MRKGGSYTKDIFNDPAVISALTSCLVAAIGLVTAVLMYCRQRLSVKKANDYAKAKQAELETENAKLNQLVLAQYFTEKTEKEKE